MVGPAQQALDERQVPVVIVASPDMSLISDITVAVAAVLALVLSIVTLVRQVKADNRERDREERSTVKVAAELKQYEGRQALRVVCSGPARATNVRFQESMPPPTLPAAAVSAGTAGQ